jgi:hypothetical protein
VPIIGHTGLMGARKLAREPGGPSAYLLRPWPTSPALRSLSISLRNQPCLRLVINFVPRSWPLLMAAMAFPAAEASGACALDELFE